MADPIGLHFSTRASLIRRRAREKEAGLPRPIEAPSAIHAPLYPVAKCPIGAQEKETGLSKPIVFCEGALPKSTPCDLSVRPPPPPTPYPSFPPLPAREGRWMGRLERAC